MSYVSQYFNGTRSAHIQVRTYGGYRVVLLDSYFETEKEQFCDTIKEAELVADRWINENFR